MASLVLTHLQHWRGQIIAAHARAPRCAFRHVQPMSQQTQSKLRDPVSSTEQGAHVQRSAEPRIGARRHARATGVSNEVGMHIHTDAHTHRCTYTQHVCPQTTYILSRSKVVARITADDAIICTRRPEMNNVSTVNTQHCISNHFSLADERERERERESQC